MKITKIRIKENLRSNFLKEGPDSTCQVQKRKNQLPKNQKSKFQTNNPNKTSITADLEETEPKGTRLLQNAMFPKTEF